MQHKVTVSPRWYGKVPTRNGKPLPKNQWARAGRKRVWIVRCRAPDGSRPQETFDTKEEADAFAAAKTAEIEREGPTVANRIRRATVAAFVDEFEGLRVGPKGGRLKAATLAEYRVTLRMFRDFIGDDTALETITKADVMRFIDSIRSRKSKRDKPIGAYTVNKHKRNVGAAFNVAIRLGYAKVNPCVGIKQDRVSNRTPGYITPAEFGALLNACRIFSEESRRLWWQTFLMVSYTAGFRREEVTHLAWSDIDFENPAIKVEAKSDGDLPAWQPKGYELRTIPVPAETITLLARMQGEVPEGSVYVFVSPERLAWIKARREAGEWREGAPVFNNLRRDFQRIVKAAGLRHITHHDLRRSCISNWARKLLPPVVQKLAGHKDIQTTMRFYVSVRDDDLAKAREAAAEALRAGVHATC